MGVSSTRCSLGRVLDAGALGRVPRQGVLLGVPSKMCSLGLGVFLESVPLVLVCSSKRFLWSWRGPRKGVPLGVFLRYELLQKELCPVKLK